MVDGLFKKGICLQARAVDNLHLNSELTATVVENKDTDAATARLESALETRPQVGLVNDLQTLLDIASLGHGGDIAILHIQDTVLLEDRAEHGLDNHARSRVGDEGRLLVQLLGEQVNTEIAVLASGGRGRDADDLARSALEHQEVAQTNVVAGDGHRVGRLLSSGSTTTTRGNNLLVDVHIDVLGVAMVVVVTVGVVVVVTHLGFLGGVLVRSDGFFGDLDLFPDWTGSRSGSFDGELVNLDLLGRITTLGNNGNVYSGVGLRTEARSVFTLSNVNGTGVRITALRTASVDLNPSISELGGRWCRSVLLLHQLQGLGVVMMVVVTMEETGTAVAFFFTRDTDLFFAKARFAARRNFGGGGERRVLTFPSGWLLGRKGDLNLLVSSGLGRSLRLVLLVSGGEDAKGHGDAGFKVQVDGLRWRERIFSYNLP